MGETGNYQLKQWEKTDRIQMEDFNADNAKIEAALAGLAAQLTTKANRSELPWVKIGEATLAESAQQVSVNVSSMEQYDCLVLVFDVSDSTAMGLMWTGMNNYTTIESLGTSKMTRCCGFVLAAPMANGGVFAHCCYHYFVTGSGTGHSVQMLDSAVTSGSVTVSVTGRDDSLGKYPLAAGSHLVVYGLKK